MWVRQVVSLEPGQSGEEPIVPRLLFGEEPPALGVSERGPRQMMASGVFVGIASLAFSFARRGRTDRKCSGRTKTVWASG